MDNSFHQQEPDSQQSRGLLASLRIFDSIEKWLTDLFEMTEEEQKEAGIYSRDEYDK